MQKSKLLSYKCKARYACARENIFYNANMITVLTCFLGNQYPCHPHWQELD